MVIVARSFEASGQAVKVTRLLASRVAGGEPCAPRRFCFNGDKLRRLRSGLYWVGVTLLGIGLYVAVLVPGWVALLCGAIGGIVIGLAAHYDSSLNQWPILRPFFDGEAAQRVAAELDREPGDGS
jgi:hypothetical protein